MLIRPFGVLSQEVRSASNCIALLSDFVVLYEHLVVLPPNEEGQVWIRRRLGEATQFRVVPKLVGQAVVLHGRTARGHEEQTKQRNANRSKKFYSPHSGGSESHYGRVATIFHMFVDHCSLYPSAKEYSRPELISFSKFPVIVRCPD